MDGTHYYRQIRLLLLELIAVGLSAKLTSLIPDSDLTYSGMQLIILLHFFAFYLSRIGKGIEQRGYLVEIEKTVTYSFVFAVLLIFSSFISAGSFEISRRGVVYFTAINSSLIYLTNGLAKHFKHIFLSSLNEHRKTLLITTEKRLPSLETLFDTDELPLKQIVGLVLMDDEEAVSTYGLPLIAKEEALLFTTRTVVDCVFIHLPSEEYDIQDLVSEFELMGIDVSINLNAFGFGSLENKKIQVVENHSIVTLSTNFYNPSHIFLKRLVDIIGALFGLAICGLVSIILVPIIRKDGGPAIFVQKRVGKNGRIFKFYKFRSMYVDAEERKKELLAQNQMQGGMFKMDEDPRITPIGRFIRKTSLDELPQFYNVLMGDMSLVGTRPPTVDEFEQYTPSQKRRLSFKPGITGLWQVSGRSNITDFEDVVKLDVAYIDNWTIWSDIKILLKTIKVVISGEGSK